MGFRLISLSDFLTRFVCLQLHFETEDGTLCFKVRLMIPLFNFQTCYTLSSIFLFLLQLFALDLHMFMLLDMLHCHGVSVNFTLPSVSSHCAFPLGCARFDRPAYEYQQTQQADHRSCDKKNPHEVKFGLYMAPVNFCLLF